MEQSDYYDVEEMWELIVAPALSKLNFRISSRDRKYNQRYDMVVDNKSLKDVRVNASKRSTERRTLRRRRRNPLPKD